MHTSTEERALKCSWHAAIALLGCFELKRSRTTIGKILSIGLILFHLDGALWDALDQSSTVQRLLRRLKPWTITS
jgi:hypothetical protein